MRSLAAIAEARPEWKALVLQGGTCSEPPNYLSYAHTGGRNVARRCVPVTDSTKWEAAAQARCVFWRRT